MVDSVGKKLQKARLEKKISLEDAARTTKMRAERIAELERDDYTNFPNLTYAKGFLVLYAKYLGVDVTDFTDSFTATNPVGVDEYEYLANAPVVRPAIVRHEQEKSSQGSFMALVVLVGVLVVGALLWYFVISFQRLGNLDKLSDQDTRSAPAAAAASHAPATGAPAPAVARAEAVAPRTGPETAVAPPAPAAAATPSAIAASDQQALAEAAAAPVEVRRAEPIQPVPAASPEQKAADVELKLQPVKTTWVKINSGDQNSAPVYEDYLYQDGRALTFKGAKFWVEVRDKDAVQIFKNGEAIPYSSPGVAIE